MEGTTLKIDLSSFQKGIYFITIRTEDFVTTRKIMKLLINIIQNIYPFIEKLMNDKKPDEFRKELYKKRRLSSTESVGYDQ